MNNMVRRLIQKIIFFSEVDPYVDPYPDPANDTDPTGSINNRCFLFFIYNLVSIGFILTKKKKKLLTHENSTYIFFS